MARRSAWLFVTTLSVSWCSAGERRIHLPAFHYPPLASQARVQGEVQARVTLAGGQSSSKPSVSHGGNPLLAPTAAAAVERAEWPGWPGGEQILVFHFQLTDPCVPRGRCEEVLPALPAAALACNEVTQTALVTLFRVRGLRPTHLA
jgi:hypothetical protein